MIVLRDHHTCESALAASAGREVLFRHYCSAGNPADASDIALWGAAEYGDSGGVRVAVFAHPTDAPVAWAGSTSDIQTVARRAGVPVIDLGEPLLLAPVVIPKP